MFISHASEDKADVARPLRDALTRLGVTVWLDEAEMRIGHSLRRKIDEGIRSSRFGVVVLSEAFFTKGWIGHQVPQCTGTA
ncbi:MAG: toll/interleukin-1 receptor domain-containing protein [Mycetocola sp.]